MCPKGKGKGEGGRGEGRPRAFTLFEPGILHINVCPKSKGDHHVYKNCAVPPRQMWLFTHKYNVIFLTPECIIPEQIEGEVGKGEGRVIPPRFNRSKV